VRQFVGECCEVGRGLEEALTDGMGGLYPAFVSWCKDSGVLPVSKIRFIDDILRVVEVGEITERRPRGSDGSRRKVKVVLGLRLLPE